jgi:hypothetical protein
MRYREFIETTQVCLTGFGSIQLRGDTAANDHITVVSTTIRIAGRQDRGIGNIVSVGR